MQPLRTCFRRSAADRLLLGHAIVLCAAVRFGSRLFSYARVVKILGRLYPLDRGGRQSAGDGIARITWAVTTAAYLLPADGACLADALTAQSLLRSRGIDSTIRFGVATDRRAVFAHAWLEDVDGPIFGFQPGRFEPLERSA